MPLSNTGRHREVRGQHPVIGETDRDDGIAGADRAVADSNEVLECRGRRRLQQSEIVVGIARHDAEHHRGLAGEIAPDVAGATFDHMVVGDDVSIGADHETGAKEGCSSSLFGSGRRALLVASHRGLGGSLREISGLVEPVGLHLGDAIGQCRDHGPGRRQVEIQDGAAARRDHQARLLKRSHDVGRHDGAEHVCLVGRGEQPGLLLSVKDDVDRGVLALFEAVAGTRKAQYP
jgi:hypothetical protein